MRLLNRLSLLNASLLAVLILSSSLAMGADALALQNEKKTLGNATVSFSQGRLQVSTGVVRREWEWTQSGWMTVSMKDVADALEYCVQPAKPQADWSIPGVIDIKHLNGAELSSVTIAERDDDGFTSKHLEVVSTITYKQAGLCLRHIVWVYPDAPGLRVKLQLKAIEGYDASKLRVTDETYNHCGSTYTRPGAVVDHIPLNLTKPSKRRYWGYYNDPGNRPFPSTDMLKEQVVTGSPVFQDELIDWAAGAAVEYGDSGVMMVKESPKAVNQAAHITGSFFINPKGIFVTGSGLAPEEILSDRFRDCWATWSIVYDGGEDALQMALKRFDAARYPVFPKRDMFIMSNTWGAGDPAGQQFAKQPYVLKEIEMAAKLGVDVVQIDGGWQKTVGGPRAKRFTPHYADGWRTIKQALEKNNLRIGLWVAIQNITMGEFKHNLDQFEFISWKSDFDKLQSRTDYEKREAQLRSVMKMAWMKTQFTLCPEYNHPRYGWYFFREFGSIYFQNIKQGKPRHLTLVPFQVLRKHWQMAKYIPSNKMQVMMNNPKRTRTDLSDAGKHSQSYCMAASLPFVPVLLQGLQDLEEAEVAELRTLFDQYKKYREDIFTGTTFPIGCEPDNSSWTGFQIVSTTRSGGYLLIFRERLNQEAEKQMRLKFLKNSKLHITDIRKGTSYDTASDEQGNITFKIDKPAEFLFLRYEMNGSE